MVEVLLNCRHLATRTRNPFLWTIWTIEESHSETKGYQQRTTLELGTGIRAVKKIDKNPFSYRANIVVDKNGSLSLRQCSKHFTYINPFDSYTSRKSRHLSSLFVKLRHWEIKQLAQGYATSKWQLIFSTQCVLVHLKL